MVLKKIISITVFLILIQAVWAESVESKLEFLFKRDDYETLMSEISDIEDDISWKRDYIVFEYKALALEKTGELDEAINIYQLLLKNKYGSLRKEFVRTVLEGKNFNSGFRNVERMKFYYTKIAELYIKKYEKLNRGDSTGLRNRLKKRVLAYINLVRKFDEDGELPEVFNERIVQKTKDLNSYNFKTSYYPILSFVSWQDELRLSRSDGTSGSTILNTTSGSCTGFGVKWENMYYEWNIENCYILGSSTVSTTEGLLSYNQSGVSVSGLYGGIGLMSHSIAEALSFGGQLNYLSRSGTWQEPVGTILDDDSYLRFGFSLRTTWKVQKFGFTLSLGKIFGNKSSHFQLATHYYF